MLTKSIQKKVRKDFKIKNLGKYHDLYVQSDTFLLAYEFEINVEINVLKYMNLILHIFISTWIRMASMLQKD